MNKNIQRAIKLIEEATGKKVKLVENSFDIQMPETSYEQWAEANPIMEDDDNGPVREEYDEFVERRTTRCVQETGLDYNHVMEKVEQEIVDKLPDFLQKDFGL